MHRLAWGKSRVRFQLPVLALDLVGLNANQEQKLENIYGDYINMSHDDVDFTIEAYKDTEIPQLTTRELMTGGQYAPVMERDSNQLRVTGCNFLAKFNFDPVATPSLLGVTVDEDITNAGVIENVLRIVCSYHALKKGGVILHSAGIVIKNQAHIFVGHSGAGKTTLSRKAIKAGFSVLSDDINLITPSGSGFSAWCVPFSGELGHFPRHSSMKKSYPVAGVYLLEQGLELSASRANTAIAFSRILANSPFVNTDDEKSKDLLDTITQLHAKVPIIQVSCRKKDSIKSIMTAIGDCHHQLQVAANAGI